MKQKLCAVIYGGQKIVYVILIKLQLILTLRALILENEPSRMKVLIFTSFKNLRILDLRILKTTKVNCHLLVCEMFLLQCPGNIFGTEYQR